MSKFCPIGLGSGIDSECNPERCAPALMIVAEGDAPMCPIAVAASSIASLAALVAMLVDAPALTGMKETTPRGRVLQNLGIPPEEAL